MDATTYTGHTLFKKLIPLLLATLFLNMSLLSDTCRAGDKIVIGIVEATGEGRCNNANSLKLCQEIRRQSFESKVKLLRNIFAEDYDKNSVSLHLFLFGTSSDFMTKNFESNRQYLLNTLRGCGSNPNSKYVFSPIDPDQGYMDIVPPVEQDLARQWRSGSGFIKVKNEDETYSLHPLFRDIFPFFVRCTNLDGVDINRQLPTETKVDLSKVDQLDLFVIADEHDSKDELVSLQNYIYPTSSLDQFRQTELLLVGNDNSAEAVLGVEDIEAKIWKTTFSRILTVPDLVHLHRDKSEFNGSLTPEYSINAGKLTAFELGNGYKLNPESKSFLVCQPETNNEISCKLNSAIIPDGIYEYGIMDGERLLATTRLSISGMKSWIFDLHKDNNEIDLSNFAEIKNGNILYLCEGEKKLTSCEVDEDESCRISWDMLRSIDAGKNNYSMKKKSCEKEQPPLLEVGVMDKTTSQILVDSFFHNSNLTTILNYPIVQASNGVYGCSPDGTELTLYSKEKNRFELNLINKLFNGFNSQYIIRTNRCQNSVGLGIIKISTPRDFANYEFSIILLAAVLVFLVFYFFAAKLSRSRIEEQGVAVKKIGSNDNSKNQ
jgi:hypothetical protein